MRDRCRERDMPASFRGWRNFNFYSFYFFIHVITINA